MAFLVRGEIHLVRLREASSVAFASEALVVYRQQSIVHGDGRHARRSAWRLTREFAAWTPPAVKHEGGLKNGYPTRLKASGYWSRGGGRVGRLITAAGSEQGKVQLRGGATSIGSGGLPQY